VDGLSDVAGAGLGPLMFAVVALSSSGHMNMASSVTLYAASASVAMAVLLGICSLMMSALLPAKLEEMAIPDEDNDVEMLGASRPRVAVLGIVLMMLGAFEYASVEGASSLQLEARSGWHPRSVAFALACSFGISAILSAVIPLVRSYWSGLSDAVINAFFMGTSMLGTLLFVESVPMSGLRILAGVCITYQGLLISNGLIEGYLYSLAILGTWLSVENLCLAIEIADNFGRILSQPITRSILDEQHGQTCFAVYLATLLVVTAVLSIVFMRAFPKELNQRPQC